MLYQLSHRGSSAGQAESLFIQGKGRFSPDEQDNLSHKEWNVLIIFIILVLPTSQGVILVVDVTDNYFDRTEHWISDIRRVSYIRSPPTPTVLVRCFQYDNTTLVIAYT